MLRALPGDRGGGGRGGGRGGAGGVGARPAAASERAPAAPARARGREKPFLGYSTLRVPHPPALAEAPPGIFPSFAPAQSAEASVRPPRPGG